MQPLRDRPRMGWQRVKTQQSPSERATERLHLTELLEFRPDQGIIRLHEQRVVILSAAAMGLLRKELIDTLARGEFSCASDSPMGITTRSVCVIARTGRHRSKGCAPAASCIGSKASCAPRFPGWNTIQPQA